MYLYAGGPGHTSILLLTRVDISVSHKSTNVVEPSCNLNVCSKNRVFLSDGFQKFQKNCDFICLGAWFLGVNLGSTTIVLL